jgi:hypothetical protein
MRVEWLDGGEGAREHMIWLEGRGLILGSGHQESPKIDIQCPKDEAVSRLKIEILLLFLVSCSQSSRRYDYYKEAL